VTIGNGVTSIGADAFRYCRSMTSIQYNGTKAQWKEIRKMSGGIPAITIICTDGEIFNN
jgi:hypothetical protein